MFPRLLAVGFLGIAATWALAANTGEVPAPKGAGLLRSALTKMAENQNCWAYTETTQAFASNGKSQGESIVRFDPSLPFDRQFTPLKIRGHEPTEKDREDFKHRGEWRARRQDEAQAEAEEKKVDDAQIYINGQQAIPDIEHAKVLSEDARSIAFELPLLPVHAAKNEMLDTIQLIARVDKTSEEFVAASMHLKHPFRVKLIAKITGYDLQVKFDHVQPEFPPMITAIDETAKASILFFRQNVRAELRRTDFRRVKPYDDGAHVKLGPLRAIDF